jgi:hypothetical protein
VVLNRSADPQAGCLNVVLIKKKSKQGEIMKKILLIGGGIVLVLLVAAGSFWGGMTYQTNQANQALANFQSARGQSASGQFPGDGTRFSAGGLPEGFTPGGFQGQGTTGQIKSVDGDVLTLSTALDVATVNLTDNTQIEMTVNGVLADLEPGLRVLITGQPDDNGVITADRIQILSANAPGFLGIPTPEQGP